MVKGKISQAILVGVLLVLAATVDADITSDHTECMQSQGSQNAQNLCKDTFPGPSPPNGLSEFLYDPRFISLCRTVRAELINWAMCYNTVDINCYKPEHQDLITSNSGLKSSLEYVCDRYSDGYVLDLFCKGFQDNPELYECLRQPVLTTPAGNNITYEGIKYKICRSQQNSIDCYRNNDILKTLCPDTQTTYSTLIEKLLPPACVAYNKARSNKISTGIQSLVVITILISLLYY